MSLGGPWNLERILEQRRAQDMPLLDKMIALAWTVRTTNVAMGQMHMGALGARAR